MIVIIARNTVTPETKAEFIAVAQPLIKASQAEPGNISYDLFEDTRNPDVLTFIEQWRDEAAIAFHNATPHFTGIIPKLGAFRTASEVTMYKPAE